MPLAGLDLQAGRTGDGAAHLHESVETAVRTGGRVHVFYGLDCCADLRAATGPLADAVTVRAAVDALGPHLGFTD